MKQILKLAAFTLLLGIISFFSCQKELSCYDCKENKPPIANADADQIVA
jgi:hypothetical protein